MLLKDFEIKELPQSPPLKKLIGPSFIILGLGLGSGEIILWPYLTSKYGMGILWGAVIGLTFQFFINMEIERYALTRGESVFVGLTRKLRFVSLWFLISTFLPWIWPGIIASSAKFAGSFIGISKTHYIAVGLLILIGLILSLGSILYKTVENLQKMLIVVGVPSILLFSIVLAKSVHWIELARGVVGIGHNYIFLPEGIPIAMFLAALAYAGAGGNLNLAQSFYIKEKGYGMGKYAGRITSLFTGKKEEVSLTGSKFENSQENLKKFTQWWRNINIEHFILFWVTGIITILLLALLSYVTTYDNGKIPEGVGFVLIEAKNIGVSIFPFAGTFFLLIITLTLFGTQLTVFDATSRILTENLILLFQKRFDGRHVAKLYYTVLWIQIAAGAVILAFGFTEPLQLLTTAAVLNAFAMFVHTGLMIWLNTTSLDKFTKPNLIRISAMSLAFLFYGSFSIYTILDKIS